MSQMLSIVVFLTAAVSIQGAPVEPSTYSYDALVDAASNGEWEKIHDFFAKSFVKEGLKDLTDVKELKPPEGGHVYAESEYTFHSRSDFNGETSEKSGGHKVINKDGTVAEFDFKPTGRPEDLFKKLGLQFNDTS